MRIVTKNPPNYSTLARVWMSILAHKAGGVAEGIRVEVNDDGKNQETIVYSNGLSAVPADAGVRGRNGTGDSADGQGSVPCAGQ